MYDSSSFAEQLLASVPLSPSDASRLIMELLESTGVDSSMDKAELINHCRSVIQEGTAIYAQRHQTLPFETVVHDMIRSKCYRRERTLNEIRQLSNRIIRNLPYWKDHPLRTLSVDDCRRAIDEVFPMPSMKKKAIVILSSIFNFGIKRGLCDSNPVKQLEAPKVVEKRIRPLSISQLRKLLDTAQKPEHRCCAPAVGLMLWAGVRPTEIERIRWEHINMVDKVIEIEPNHAKTGGSRLITLHPVLKRWLRHVGIPSPACGTVVPPAWTRRWRSLRKDAGFNNWKADTLRHTYASYHLRFFRDMKNLQLDMGHADTDLLRTRYLAMSGITTHTAAQFWGVRTKVPDDRK